MATLSNVASGRIWNTCQKGSVREGVEQPNAVRALWSILGALRTIRRPSPGGRGSVDHSGLTGTLKALKDGGLGAIADRRSQLSDYLKTMATVDPDRLSRLESLAFWLNVYNASAIGLAVEAHQEGLGSVLRIPGAFSRPTIEIAGEALSLDAIEHAKVRRFKIPSIHGALVCGSASCPTFRPTPYEGADLHTQLDHQLETFLRGGAAVADGPNGIKLSRVFLWYGGDFVRPHRMPTFLPATKASLLRALQPWLPESMRGEYRVRFQSYSWELRCAVA